MKTDAEAVSGQRARARVRVRDRLARRVRRAAGRGPRNASRDPLASKRQPDTDTSALRLRLPRS